ncbi:hypothetical protein [Halococcus sp. IIIV-5B]|uniref:hypothetical protein n=1 Tax=Halococcus sp. IIIV-5B TaxID=2321230 RepID=UPI0018F72FCF
MNTVIVNSVYIVVPEFVGLIVVIPSESIREVVEDTRVAIAGVDVCSAVSNVAYGPNLVPVVVKHGGSTVLVGEG